MTIELKTERSRVRRLHERGYYDRETIDTILAAQPLCHISFIDEFGTPAIIPTIQWREGDHIYWHASSKARSFKAMNGQDIAVAVTLMDGFVMARSAMHHSMNHRSVVLYGRAFEVEKSQKEAKLKGMFDVLFPERWDKLRPINEVELKQTSVFGIKIAEGSAKIRNAGVSDDVEDLSWPVWAGVIPISYALGTPIPDNANKVKSQINQDAPAINLG